MRTTLTLDDDVADFVREQSRVQNKSLKQVVNETLRLGMTQDSRPADVPMFQVTPNRSGFVEGIDTAHLNRLNDEIEVLDFLAETTQ